MEMFETLNFRLSHNHLNNCLSKRKSQLNFTSFTQMKHFPVGSAGENSQGEFLSSFKETDKQILQYRFNPFPFSTDFKWY